MGGVAVLQPQDVLKERLPRLNPINSPNFGSIKSRSNPNTNSNPKPNPNPNFISNPEPNPSFISNPKPNPVSTRSSNGCRKRSPSRLSNSSTTTTAVAANQKPRNALVMEQVKILKRGEALDQATKAVMVPKKEERGLNTKVLDDFVLSSTDRLGPEPDIVPKQVTVAGFFAGAAFFESPPPSSVPVPTFFKKTSVLTQEHDATSDLRRILGLNLA
ncbi:unnamed protein product [Ilex paraguariensis]|uniref:Uncharacterized protein n=1 Tax=Ilex paraguariensis TaxID=185542 RepID=A0ABC8UWU2_9AQUA